MTDRAPPFRGIRQELLPRAVAPWMEYIRRSGIRHPAWADDRSVRLVYQDRRHGTRRCSRPARHPAPGFPSAAPPRRCRSQDQPPDVLEDVAQVASESRGQRTIDDAVIIGDTNGQHQTWDERLAIPHRCHFRTHHAENCHFWRIDDWRKGRTTYTAET